MKALFLAVLVTCMLGGAVQGQVIVSNSMVTYGYESSPAGSYAPPSPLVSESPYSRIAFSPNNFVASSTDALPNPVTGAQIASETAILTLDMTANSGMWFTGTNALALDVGGSYSMTAPFSISESFVSVTASYTVYLQEVDGVAFTSPSPLSGALSIAPTNFFSLNGPGGVSSGLWNSALSLDINTIKAHFGIAPSSNVTGMRLQYSSTLTGASLNGSASIDTLNVNVTNQVVPEPSTYALLALAAAGLAARMVRRRKG